MNIPTFLQYKWVDKDGGLTDAAAMYHDELNRAMQGGLSDNGWTLPRQTFTNIQAVADQMPVGSLWWDTDNARIVVKQSDSPTVLYELDMTLIP